jgi:assimilatory nitrate reductase catalytic subunit
MGSRLYSNITSLVAGRSFADETDRLHVSRVLGIPEQLIPSEAGWAYDQIVDGARSGRIKGLWVIATNGAHSWIQQDDAADAFSKLEWLVVQDMYPTTETAQRAHLYLPAAGWGEKEGTLINSERRIGLVKKVRRAPGSALTDFQIFRLVAEYWGCGDMFRAWRTPEAAFQILKELSRGQPCDMTGIRDYAMIDASGGIQWPWSEGNQSRPDTSGAAFLSKPYVERRLFEDGCFFTPDRRARFVFEEPRPVAEPVDSEYPFVLLTGRGTAAQWHTGTRTNKSDVLRALSPSGCYVEIHPADAARLGIAANRRVIVQSRRAGIEALAFITPTVQQGQVFIPMHYPEVNRLTRASFDPYSRQPAYKHCAVKVLADDGFVHPD